MSILDYFPLPTQRKVQTQLLTHIESNYSNKDVITVVASTATGKSAIAVTIANWLHEEKNSKVRIIVPNNLLLNQYLDSYPYLVSRSQKFVHGSFSQAGIGLTNYATHAVPIARGADRWKPYIDCLIVDEAHNLIDFIRENETFYLLQHKYNYPEYIDIEWAKQNAHRHKNIQYMIDHWNNISIEGTTRIWKGGGTDINGCKMIRGEEYEVDALKVTPIDISSHITKYIPRKTKVILLSSTIASTDLEVLGLDGRKCIYLESTHPIPYYRRPIRLNYACSVSRNNMVDVSKLLASKISDIASMHPKQKGLVHATYPLARLLSEYLEDSRYLYHNSDNRLDVYQEFRESEASQGKILIASGMYEGIDLPEDLGRFQVIAKIPWLSLADPVNKYYFNENPSIYEWNTIKTTVQACGRISRTPTDFGVTYIIDGSFERIRKSTLLPEWFNKSLVDMCKK